MDPTLFSFGWHGAGVVKEKRELKTKEGKVFKHVLKVAGMGETYEVEVQPETYAKFGEGQIVYCRGTFEFYNGKAQFVAAEVTENAPNASKKAA